MTDSYPSCQFSSLHGKLEGVFIKTGPLGVSDPSTLTVSGSDSLSIVYPYCVRNGTAGVTYCHGVNMSGGVQSDDWDLGFAVTGPNISWSGSRNADIGCFFLTGLTRFNPPNTGWKVGLKYSGTEAGSSTMVKGVCGKIVDTFSSNPLRLYNLVSTQVSSPSYRRCPTACKSVKGSGELIDLRLGPPAALCIQMFVGDDDRQGKTVRVCTHLDVSGIACCLSFFRLPQRRLLVASR